MSEISKKWDLNRIPAHWIFTKAEANNTFKKAITAAKKKPLPGVPANFIKMVIMGKPFYAVSFFTSEGSERAHFTKDLWESYGFFTHLHNGNIYVRRK